MNVATLREVSPSSRIEKEIQRTGLRVAFASGGTGGHLYPGLSIAGEMAEQFPGSEALFLVSEKPVETQIMQKTRFPFHAIPSCPPKMGQVRRFLARGWEGYHDSLSLLRDFRPHALVALGGFACLGPALAARRLGIPLFIQEQNCLAGRASALLAFLAKGVFVPFEGMQKQFPFSRVIPTGNPIRRSAFAAERAMSRRSLGLADDPCTVLVLGGSQGARFLNDLVMQSLDRLAELKESLQWIHLAGAQDADKAQEAYAAKGWRAVVFPFFEQMGLCYGAADFVVSRAGASTLAEIVANGMASVLVPFPGALRDHQKKNARMLADKGAACLLEQDQLTPSAFSTVLKSFYRDPGRLDRMKQAVKKGYRGNAAEMIARELFQRAGA